ncbi:MAG: aspartate--tRNA ligase [Patescibacteria group bacterium]
MKITRNIDVNEKIGAEVTLYGWVNTRRNMGKIAFIDLRDRSALLQVVLVPAELDETSAAHMPMIRPEYVLKITGIVQERGEKQKNADLATGGVEVLAKSLEIINEAETPPFEIDNEDRQANEELRMKHRYLDLRHERMKDNMVLRHDIIKYMREFFYDKDFLEIETPFISKSTPEGARDFLVPSRNWPGKFYALPQSPQQYKQMLMVAGMERYFQIVRCFRDEDARGDRQPEFTQLDVEMSFVEQEDILQMVETLVKGLVESVTPDKKFTFTPFKRLTFDEAMKEYGTDRPDLRKDKNDPDELAFAFVLDFPMFEYKEGDERWGATHHPFTSPQTDDIEKLDDKDKMGEIKAFQYDLVVNGYEVAGGSIRTHDPKVLQRVFELLGHTEKEIEEQFGHLLESFKYGVPPHGGVAFGLDRLIMVMAGEPSIREVIAFPKTTDNRDILMDGPSEVPQEQLDELGLSINKK